MRYTFNKDQSFYNFAREYVSDQHFNLIPDDINDLRDPFGHSLIYEAAMTLNYELIVDLVERKGVDINSKNTDRSGSTPLSCATYNAQYAGSSEEGKYVEILSYLLSHKSIDASVVDEDSCSYAWEHALRRNTFPNFAGLLVWLDSGKLTADMKTKFNLSIFDFACKEVKPVLNYHFNIKQKMLDAIAQNQASAREIERS